MIWDDLRSLAAKLIRDADDIRAGDKGWLSKEAKIYADGKINGLRYAGTRLSDILSRHQQGTPQLVHDSGDYLFTDMYGAIWRLRPTADQSCPMTITLEERPPI